MPTVRKKREAEEKSPSRNRTSSLLESHKGALKCTSCNLQDRERNFRLQPCEKTLGLEKAVLLLRRLFKRELDSSSKNIDATLITPSGNLSVCMISLESENLCCRDESSGGNRGSRSSESSSLSPHNWRVQCLEQRILCSRTECSGSWGRRQLGEIVSPIVIMATVVCQFAHQSFKIHHYYSRGACPWRSWCGGHPWE